MLGILLCGCGGVMGRNVAECAASERFCDKLTITAGVDIKDTETKFPCYRSIDSVTFPVGALVDFSHPSLISDILRYALKYSVPAVIATTGHSAGQRAEIEKAAERIPVFYTANMSLGVSLLNELIKKAVSVLGDDCDIEIIEKHHNRKLDAPSGTALMLADTIEKEESRTMNLVYDRHAERRARRKNEIGIHSVRGGTIVGEHDVIFACEDEVLTLSHSAGSRKIFATGALRAALFLADRQPGLYSMNELISED